VQSNREQTQEGDRLRQLKLCFKDLPEIQVIEQIEQLVCERDILVDYGRLTKLFMFSYLVNINMDEQIDTTITRVDNIANLN